MKILEALVALIKVKSIITFAVIAVFVILAARGGISADNVMIVTTTIIGFYFGTQSGSGKGGAA